MKCGFDLMFQRSLLPGIPLDFHFYGSSKIEAVCLSKLVLPLF
jgi:hypothetical protein